MENSYQSSIEYVSKLVQDHKGDWEEIDKTILDIVANAQKITIPAVKDLGSIRGLNEEIQKEINLRKQLAEQVQKQEQIITRLQKKITSAATSGRKQLTEEEKLNKKVEQSERRLNQVRNDKWKSVEQNRKASREEAQAIRNALTVYGKYSQELTQITREYKDLAIRKERNNDLTEEEIKRMDALGTRIDSLRGSLVKVDHRVGQFGRSVGSYGKQFDSLGFSVAQLTREMPAFAYGAQIGFAALSNNIPIFVDEISKAKKEVASLRAEGKATTGVLGRLSKAIFSWQSLISVGVTLLTLYGAELIEMSEGLFDAKDAASAAERAQKKYTEALEEGTGAIEAERVKLEALVEIAGDETEERGKRNDAVKILQNMYPDYLGNLTTENTKSKEIAESINDIVTGLENKAKAQAAEKVLAEQAQKYLEDTMSIQEKFTDRIADAKERAARSARLEAEGYKEANKIAGESNLVETLERQQKVAMAKASIEYEAFVNQLKETYKNIPDLMDVFGDDGSGSGGSDATREQIESIQEMNRFVEGSVEYYNNLLGVMRQEQSRLATNTAEWQTYKEQIEETEDALMRITDFHGWLEKSMAMSKEELDDFGKEVVDVLTGGGIESGMKALVDITGESLDELYDQFTSFYESDFESFSKFFDDKVAKSEEGNEKMADLQKQLYEESIKLVNDLFEGEIEKIELKIEENKDYYATLLDNANLTEERRSALEAERDAKERKLLKEKRKREREQFLFEKSIALAKAIINVAAAITEFGVISPQAILAGIIGAIQVAQIAAQTIPKFAVGTENAPAGMAIVDEFGPEVHTDKHGNVKSFGSTGGPNKRFLEEGDKIYKSRQEYFRRKGADSNMQAIEDTIWNLNMQYQGAAIPAQDVTAAFMVELSALRDSNERLGKQMKAIASRPVNVHNNVVIDDKRPY